MIVIRRQEEPEQKRKVTFQLGQYAKEFPVIPNKVWLIDDDHRRHLSHFC